MRPDAAREGDDYVFTWPDERVVMVLAELREHAGDLFAELTACGLGEDGQRYHITGPLKQNLLGPQARTTTARILATRDDQERPADVWTTFVEQAFALTVRSYRQGDPVVTLNGAGPALAPRQYLLEPLLPLGETTMVYADGAGGKSYLGLLCALAATTGQPLAAKRIEPRQAPVPVLYLDWETSREALDRRWSRVCRGLGVERPSLHYLRLHRPLVPEGPRIRRLISQLGIGLVIVDSLGFAVDTEMTAGEAATHTVGVANTFGCTSLLLHHMSKADVAVKGGRAEAYGTIYFRNAVRNAWEMRCDAGENDQLGLALYHRKTNEGRLRRGTLGLALVFEGEAGPVQLSPFDPRESDVLAERIPLTERIEHLLGDVRGGLSYARLADDLGVSAKSVQNAVSAHRRLFSTTHEGSRAHEVLVRLRAYQAEEEVPW